MGTCKSFDIENLPPKKDVFNLEKIPKEVLDRGWKYYGPYVFNIDHRNPFANSVAISVYDLKRATTKTFPITDEQFTILNRENGCAHILVAMYADNVKIIEKKLEKKGYWRCNRKEDKVIVDTENRQWLDMCIEPIPQNDVTEEVHTTYKTLYYFAPSVEEGNILKTGIQMSGDKVCLYLTIDDVKEKVDILCKSSTNQGTSDYSMFCVDLTTMGYNIRFLYDNNYPGTVYTKDVIPSEYIVKIE